MDQVLFSQKHTLQSWGEQIPLLLCCYVLFIKYCITNAPKHMNFLNSDQSESSSNWLNIWKVKRDERS